MIERYLFQREVVEDEANEPKVSHRVEIDFEADFLTDIAEQFHSFLIASGFSYVSAVAVQKSNGDVACSDGWEYSPDDEDDDDDEYED